MNNLEIILKLINEKRAHLISYEVFSTKLIHSDLDLLNDFLDQRELIIQSINEIDQNIFRLVEEDAQSLTISNIIQRRLLKGEINDMYLTLYEGIKSIHDSLENIQGLERILLKRIEIYKEELFANIKQTNTVSKIKKYFETYETEIDDMALMISKSSKA